MSYVMAAPEMMAAAATDLATIGSNLSAAHTAAAAPTVAVMPAAADEVSASIAQVFSRAAQEYQALAGQAAAFNQKFVQHLTASAGSYAAAGAANAASLPHLTASAGSAASAISDLPGQILNTLTSVATGFLNGLGTLAFFVEFFVNLSVFLVYITTYLTLLLAFGVLYLGDLLLKGVLAGFGVSIPF
jgi:PE family